MNKMGSGFCGKGGRGFGGLKRSWPEGQRGADGEQLWPPLIDRQW